MKRASGKFIVAILFALSLCLPGNEANAQCAMCRASAESNMKKPENKVGAGLNKGILYLMSIPYIIGGIAGIVWYRNRKDIKAFINKQPE